MKKNYLLIIIGFSLAGLVIWFGLNSFGGTTDNLPKTASLTLESDDRTVKVGEEFAVNMVLDSGDSEIAAADFVIKFDPNLLEVTDISTGNYFSTYPINTKSEDTVKISGVASFDGESIILPKGKDSVALISFKSKAKGTAKIGFDGKKTIVATEGQNILNNKNLSFLEVTISD